ncbi:hypothetical protein MPSEU_000469900 [Mayamaea pseudoterrestris]|nr:hypothetical protein MPSEU_000469900 [Mayamaea pseudoterrestris]
MRLRCLKVLVGLLGTSAVTHGVRDSAWHNGIETPNVELPMYWGDMPNILEDLSKFSNLYVKYHSCAWTHLGGYGDQEDTGRDVEENDYWYMGSMNSGVGWSYAPQVAFSLYGTLKGSRRKGCGKQTYINSFYTTSGFYAFSNAIANAGIANNGNDFSLYCQSGVKLSCSSVNHDFSAISYSDSYCTRGNEQGEGVPNALAAFNDALNEAKCVEVYDVNNGYIPYLLYHARSCELHDEAGACPDPYGRKTYYDRRLSRALSGLAPDDEKFHQELLKGYTFIGLGFSFIGLAAMFAVYEKFYGPRRVVKTTQVDFNKHLDVEAPIDRKHDPIVEKHTDKGLPDSITALFESPTDEQSECDSLSASKASSFEHAPAGKAMRFAPNMLECGGNNTSDSYDDGFLACGGGPPTLEFVLDQVEDAVAAANIQCTSEEKIMACVQVAMDGTLPEIECTPYVVDDDASIADAKVVCGEQQAADSILEVMPAQSHSSQSSKSDASTRVDVVAASRTKEEELSDSKTQGEEPLAMQQSGDANEAKVRPDSDSGSPKGGERRLNKLKFWKG